MFEDEMFGQEKYEISKQFRILPDKNRRNVHQPRDVKMNKILEAKVGSAASICDGKTTKAHGELVGKLVEKCQLERPRRRREILYCILGK